jgi:hypothetical protein
MEKTTNGTTYEERLNEYLGPVNEGETRYFGIPDGDIVAHIKKHLEGNYSVALWTYECPEEQIKENDKVLTEAGIVHYHDKIMDGFVCFNSEEDMNHFRSDIDKISKTLAK